MSDNDEPETLSYQIALNGPIGADVRHSVTLTPARKSYERRAKAASPWARAMLDRIEATVAWVGSLTMVEVLL